MKSIETERLILRGFESNDLDDVCEFLSQRKFDLFEAYPDINYENAKAQLEKRIVKNEFYALELKETGKVIGNVYFADRPFFAKELGYIVNKNYQRRGYAAEAVKAILREAFKSGVHRVFAECDPRNLCSWKLLEHLGFTKEACFSKNVFFGKDENGTPIWQDTYVYCLLNENDI